MPITLLPCGHAFHAVCIEPVLRRGSPSCPLCRVPLFARASALEYLAWQRVWEYDPEYAALFPPDPTGVALA